MGGGGGGEGVSGAGPCSPSAPSFTLSLDDLRQCRHTTTPPHSPPYNPTTTHSAFFVHRRGTSPIRCARNSSKRTLVFCSISSLSMASVGTSAIITRRIEFAMERSVLLSVNRIRSSVSSCISTLGILLDAAIVGRGGGKRNCEGGGRGARDGKLRRSVVLRAPRPPPAPLL